MFIRKNLKPSPIQQTKLKLNVFLSSMHLWSKTDLQLKSKRIKWGQVSKNILQFNLGFSLEVQWDCHLRENFCLPTDQSVFSLTCSLTEMKKEFGLLLEYTKATSKLSQSAIRGQTNIKVTVINHIHCNYVNGAWNHMWYFRTVLVLSENIWISKLTGTKNAWEVLARPSPRFLADLGITK